MQLQLRIIHRPLHAREDPQVVDEVAVPSVPTGEDKAQLLRVNAARCRCRRTMCSKWGKRGRVEALAKIILTWCQPDTCSGTPEGFFSQLAPLLPSDMRGGPLSLSCALSCLKSYMFVLCQPKGELSPAAGQVARPLRSSVKMAGAGWHPERRAECQASVRQVTMPPIVSIPVCLSRAAPCVVLSGWNSRSALCYVSATWLTSTAANKPF